MLRHAMHPRDTILLDEENWIYDTDHADIEEQVRNIFQLTTTLLCLGVYFVLSETACVKINKIIFFLANIWTKCQWLWGLRTRPLLFVPKVVRRTAARRSCYRCIRHFVSADFLQSGK